MQEELDQLRLRAGPERTQIPLLGMAVGALFTSSVFLAGAIAHEPMVFSYATLPVAAMAGSGFAFMSRRIQFKRQLGRQRALRMRRDRLELMIGDAECQATHCDLAALRDARLVALQARQQALEHQRAQAPLVPALTLFVLTAAPALAAAVGVVVYALVAVGSAYADASGPLPGDRMYALIMTGAVLAPLAVASGTWLRARSLYRKAAGLELGEIARQRRLIESQIVPRVATHAMGLAWVGRF